jgi:hypothetical protein
VSATLAGNGHAPSTVTIQCPACAWSTQMTANDLMAIARVLGARFAAHVSACHPEQLLASPLVVGGRPS